MTCDLRVAGNGVSSESVCIDEKSLQKLMYSVTGMPAKVGRRRVDLFHCVVIDCAGEFAESKLLHTIERYFLT